MFASVYVPVRPHARATFLRRLRLTRLITKNTIVGADRNTVADVSLDVKHARGSETQYLPLRRCIRIL